MRRSTPEILAGVLTFVGLVLRAVSPAAAQTASDLFDDDTLHEIRLVIHSGDWRSLQENFRENTYYPCDLHWRGQRVQNVGIRSRGLGSRSGRKPGLRVDIDRYATEQQFLGLKSFILDNVNRDVSLVRERVTMKFYERMGLPAPREAHTRLYVNNEFAGVYVIVESIDKDFLGRVFGARDGDVENDGYLFEYKHLYPYHFSHLGPDLDPYSWLFDPKTHENAPAEELYRPIEAMMRTVSDASDETFAGEVGQFLDLPLLMRQVAVENFIAEYDGLAGFWGVNNFYFYRFENGQRSQFLAWDKDSTFHAANHPILFNLEANVLLRRAMAVPELREVYFAALREAAQVAAEREGGEETGWLQREIERAYWQIRLSVYDDPSKWQSNSTFEIEIERMIEFARTRSRFVLCEVGNALSSTGPIAACSAPDTTGPQ